jgi:PAS domain S-box-containing protein
MTVDMDTDIDLLRARLVELERENARLAQELRLQQQMYSTLVEDQREIICRFNPDGTLAFVNDAYCRYFGKTRDELVGKVFTPLVGRIDEKRAQLVLETLLHGVVDMAAETVLLDVTGITIIDTQVAEALVRTAQAVKLLGARVVLTGIQPHVAQTLVSMGIEVHGIITLRNLKEGIAWAMQSRGKVQAPVKSRR